MTDPDSPSPDPLEELSLPELDVEVGDDDVDDPGGVQLELPAPDGDEAEPGEASDLPLDLELAEPDEDTPALGDDATGLSDGPTDLGLTLNDRSESLIGSDAETGLGDDATLGIEPLVDAPDHSDADGLDDPAGEHVDAAGLPDIDGDEGEEEEGELDVGLDIEELPVDGEPSGTQDDPSGSDSDRRASRGPAGLLGAALLLAVTIVATTSHAAPPRLFGPQDPGRLKVHGGLPVVFTERPCVDGSRRRLPPLDRAPVVVTFTSPPSAADVDALRAAGAEIPLDRNGLPLGRGRMLAARLSPEAVRQAAALPQVESLHLDGSPFGVVRPLDGNAAEIEAPAVWRSQDALSLPLAGQGITICDLDSGVDVFQPMFFRADGGYHGWIDVDESGSFTPGVDAVDAGADGVLVPLRVLDGIVTHAYGDEVLFDSDDPSYALGMDWLYADLNENGVRDFGRAAGFDDSSPSLGEPLYVADDVNKNGLLDVGEKLVALGSSKIKLVRWDDDRYRRGENLIDVPFDDEIDHGTASTGVLVGGQRGLSTLVGIAPEADLIMTVQRDHYMQEFAHSSSCIAEGARVVLHEYGLWWGVHLDGSSPMEGLIDQTSFEGIAHINPSGNLGPCECLYKRDHPAGTETVIEVEAPDDFRGEAFTMVLLSVLWRDPGRQLDIVLEDPTGFSMTMPATEDVIFEEWHDGLYVQAERVNSGRGTARLDMFVWGPYPPFPPIPPGTWLVRMADLEPSGTPDLEVITYVGDDLSGWGKGIYFPSHSSRDHLVTYPGTADHAITIGAYTGHGYWGQDPPWGGPPGELPVYSGRGWRIDGEAIMDITAPDDPISAGYREGAPARYRIYGGTSGASPHVAGAAALILQANPAATGADVRHALHAGALVDEHVGSAPNHDWGYGKLRIHRSIFGTDPPGGSPPLLQPLEATVAIGQAETLSVAVDDPDEPVESLVLELDRDYDGAYDEQLDGASFDVLLDELGTTYAKLRATDSTGRQATALATITVVEPEPEPQPSAGRHILEPAGGCACTSAPSPGRPLGWLALLLPLGLLLRHERRV